MVDWNDWKGLTQSPKIWNRLENREVDEVGFSIRDSKVSKSLTDILSEIGYSYNEIYNRLREQISNISSLSSQDRDSIFRNIEKYFHMDNYLNRDETWG